MNTMNWEKEGAGGDFTVYPEGTYKVSINNYEPVTASTGTKQIRWKATILEPKKFIGQPITLHTALTEKSLWKLARLVKACGLDLKSLGTQEIGSQSFMKVLESCRRRTSYWHLAVVMDNKGKEKNEVDDFKLDTEQEVEKIEAESEPDWLKS